MDTLTRLLKEGKLAKICKQGAWAVVVLGILHIVVVIYADWQINIAQQQQQTLGQLGPTYYVYDTLILPNIAAVLQDAATIIFYFLVLYVIGTVLGAFASPPPPSDVTYQSLDEVEEDLSVDEEIAHT